MMIISKKKSVFGVGEKKKAVVGAAAAAFVVVVVIGVGWLQIGREEGRRTVW